MLKEIAILSAKCIYAHFDCQIYLWYICIVVDHRVGIFPFSVSVMLQTLCSFQSAQPRTLFWKVMLKLTLIHSRLEIPHTNYVVQSNTAPITCKYVHAYQDMIPFKNNQKLIMS